MEKIAMQGYCVHCGQEQYAPDVWDISHGKQPCAWCGEMSKEMSYEEYSRIIRSLREKNAKET